MLTPPADRDQRARVPDKAHCGHGRHTQQYPAHSLSLCSTLRAVEGTSVTMAPGLLDPRMTSIKPRIRYNTIGGVNGPLVILDNVGCSAA